MRPAFAALLGALLLASCGTDEAPDPATQEALVVAQEAAADARDAFDGLEDRVAALEALGDKRGERLGELEDRLTAALDRLKASIRDVRAGMSGAAEDASAALSQAYGVVRDLSVLENRFDYHLRRDHGGG